MCRLMRKKIFRPQASEPGSGFCYQSILKELDLVAIRRTSQPQHFVDNRSHITGKKLSYVKYSSKRSDFLRFFAYLCHVIDDFACLDLQH